MDNSKCRWKNWRRCGVMMMIWVVVGTTPARADPIQRPASFAYVLQADALTSTREKVTAILADCGRDWIILDASFTGQELWTAADIARIRAARSGRRVIAYLSIGEAEDYRPYWRAQWDADKDGHPDAGAPGFLLSVNPDWAGNYRVRYWDAQWQQIILEQLDRIMAQGFDGVYLDIVDGFETFERDGDDFVDDRINPQTRHSYRRDMIDWVKKIAARAQTHNPSALVIPQNGAQLLADADYLQTISAIGIEDLFTQGNKRQPASHVSYMLSLLAPATKAGKVVLDIEYPTITKRKQEVRDKSSKQGFILLLADRDLKTLGESDSGPQDK